MQYCPVLEKLVTGSPVLGRAPWPALTHSYATFLPGSYM
jgi:hypothetical protein